MSLLAAGLASSQTLYKFRGADGEWSYTDRPPAEGQSVEVLDLGPAQSNGSLKVEHRIAGNSVEIVADNGYHAPVELSLAIDELRGLALPDPDQRLLWVLPPTSRQVLLRLSVAGNGVAPAVGYRYRYVAGDPGARHEPDAPYRVPYAISSDYPITQAYPDVITHTTPDSYHAVDIAMPIGTDVFAARGGIVFDIARSNFKSGLDPDRDLRAANYIRILHDDGTYAIYAHLHWDSIRVRPGDRVARGQYIADSGNTGFSSGPHLHFAVIRNNGLEPVSVPFEFAGRDYEPVLPASGNLLTAY